MGRQDSTRNGDPQRGSAMLISMVVIMALTGLGLVAVTNVRSGSQASSHARFERSAMFAAESGVAAAMEYLRATPDWGTITLGSPVGHPAVVGGGIKPGQVNYPFSATSQASYEVTFRNNVEDTASGDSDKRLVIRSQGTGADGTSVIIEVEVGESDSSARCSAGYTGQRGFGADGRGVVNCVSLTPAATATVVDPNAL